MVQGGRGPDARGRGGARPLPRRAGEAGSRAGGCGPPAGRRHRLARRRRHRRPEHAVDHGRLRPGARRGPGGDPDGHVPGEGRRRPVGHGRPHRAGRRGHGLRDRGPDRRPGARRRPHRHDRRRRHLQVPAPGLRRRRAARRGHHHRQHVHHSRGPAPPPARAAARRRRQPRAGQGTHRRRVVPDRRRRLAAGPWPRLRRRLGRGSGDRLQLLRPYRRPARAGARVAGGRRRHHDRVHRTGHRGLSRPADRGAPVRPDGGAGQARRHRPCRGLRTGRRRGRRVPRSGRTRRRRLGVALGDPRRGRHHGGCARRRAALRRPCCSPCSARLFGAWPARPPGWRS